MIPIRRSKEKEPNRQIETVEPKQDESNVALLKRKKATNGIVLIGGTSVSDFRVRIAQSHLRHDLLPSYWSVVGVLDGSHLVTVPLHARLSARDVPRFNGIVNQPLSDYDDAREYPNIACLNFISRPQLAIAATERLKGDRSIVDLPSLLIHWLAFTWAAGDATNPLLAGKGLPSAALAETAYAIAGVELTPGLSSASSCPEAIWQAAKWWHGFYEAAGTQGSRQTKQQETAEPVVPNGFAAIRQWSAAVVEK